MRLRNLAVLLLLLATFRLPADNTTPAVSTGAGNVVAATNGPAAEAPYEQSEEDRALQRKILTGFMAVMLVIAGVYVRRAKGGKAVR
jgi:hypothetical protein